MTPDQFSGPPPPERPDGAIARPTNPVATSETENPSPGQRHRKGLTIRLKLTLWYGGLFLLAGVLLIAINFFMVRNSLNIAPDKAVEAVAEEYGIPRELLQFGAPFGSHPGEFQRFVTVNGVPVGKLIDAAQRELRAEALRQLWIRSLLALAIMTVITFGLAWLLAGRMLRPLHVITRTARRLSESTLHERIALRGPRDELQDLADTFDDMLGRLDAAFTAQKEFVANASHELRTPLTIIRTEIDVALGDPEISPEELKDMGEAVTEAVDRSERLIDGLLTLAQAESTLNLVDLDLADIAEKQVELASAEADAMGLRLDLDLQPAAMKGDRTLLERLAGNLVENAIRHNVENGWFSVHTSTQGDKVILRVANSGAAVAPDEVSKLFDRFYRPDKSRSRKTGGFGLGLSIVKSVAEAHNGSVDIAARPEGGLDVTVTLPSLPEAPAADQGSDS